MLVVGDILNVFGFPYSQILPALEDKNGAPLLTELMLKWSGYQVFARWLSRFFEYLDRFYVPRVEGFLLLDLAVKCFDDLVSCSNVCLLPVMVIYES